MVFLLFLLISFVTGSEYCQAPTDADCQDVVDIGGQHIYNRWPCDCQKVWWCEDGKLQTDICTPNNDGTETYVVIYGSCVNVADIPWDICKTDDTCQAELPTDANCTAFQDGYSDDFPLPCNCRGWWYCNAGKVNIEENRCSEGQAFVPNTNWGCRSDMDSSYCKKPLISTSTTSTMTTSTTATNCSYMEGRIWEYNEKTDTIMQVIDDSDGMDCVVQCFDTMGCDAVSLFKDIILNHMQCILHHAPLNRLDCNECSSVYLPDRLNLDLVKFGYTGEDVDTENEIDCWLQCLSSPVCNYYTFKNTSSPEQVGTCYLIQDYVEASSCDSCFSGIVNCIEN